MSYFTWWELMRRQQNPEVPPVSPLSVIGLYGSNAEGTITSFDELTDTEWTPLFGSVGTGLFALQNQPENTVGWAQGIWRFPGSPDQQAVISRFDQDIMLSMIKSGAPDGIDFTFMPVEFLFFPIPIV